MAGNWVIDKDGKELGHMSIGYTRMDVNFMGQRYNYTCNQFDYSEEKYLLRYVCFKLSPCIFASQDEVNLTLSYSQNKNDFKKARSPGRSLRL